MPINTVKTVAAQIIKTGHVEHAYLGIAVQAVTPSAAKLFHLPATHGLLVARVQPGSGAAKAGLRAGTGNATLAGESYPLGGDLITKIDSTSLYSLDQLPRRGRRQAAGRLGAARAVPREPAAHDLSQVGTAAILP